MSSATLTGATAYTSGLQAPNCEVVYNVEVSGPGTYSTPISAGNIGGYQYDADASTLTVTGNVFEVSMTFQKSTIYQ